MPALVAISLCAAPFMCAQAASKPAPLARIEQATPPNGASDMNAFKGLRPQAIRQTAYTYALQEAVNWRYKQFEKQCKTVSHQLSQTFDFSALTMDNGRVQPAVITQGDSGWKQISATASKSVDREYQILEPEKVISTPKTWRDYLIRSYPVSDKPNPALYPKNGNERRIWESAADKGWADGMKLALHLFQTNVNRMKRDYLGMVLFHRLADQGLVSIAMTAESKPRIAVNGKKLSIGEHVFRITLPSHWQSSTHWKPGAALDR